MEQPSFKDLYSLRSFRAFWVTIFNILCIFFIDFRTLIPLTLLWIILIVSMIIGYHYSLRKLGSEKQIARYHGFCFGPAIVHIILILNLLISFNPREETYAVHRGIERVHNRAGHARQYIHTLIYLEDDKYDAYTGIRLFRDESQIRSSTITYTFATGMFGITVMRDWEFN